ncbi:hypothetical protein [Massilia sp. H6]|uniref:hypothetical protein n=1 Tax=Massilia sp. H6 TaxID=2970464 RepID=UPI002169AE31|nr:hypothetical protein [Massilia sp. H6]UVW27055.1 hypothetical protein NRS07_10770 [Massilia sp. H6]
MSKSEKLTYMKEFRTEAVKPVLEQGMSLEEAGVSLALPKGTLANSLGRSQTRRRRGSSPRRQKRGRAGSRSDAAAQGVS